MDKERILEKLDWLFKSALTAPDPTAEEFKEEQFLFFENYVRFLQDNGFTTRVLLKENEKATAKSQIKVGDLTPDGLKFYFYGIRKWRENIPTKLNSKLKKSVNFVCSVKEKSSPTTLH